MTAALFIIAAFIAGSIPFGYVVGRLFYGIDIRTKGSGNIGAANALRTMGTTGALIVLVLDALKGFLPAFVAQAMLHEAPLTAAVAAAAVLGHCFSPFLAGRGGKGVATALGALFALSWAAGCVCIAVWLVVAVASGFSSAGSLSANLAAPFALWFFTREAAYVIYAAVAACVILFKHRDNIKRLRTGKEHVLGILRPWRKQNEGN